MFRNRNLFANETGSGIVGFVLVAPLVVAVFIAIGQISIVVADKSVLNSAATIGARAASAADASYANGFAAARSVLASRGRTGELANISVAQEQVQGINFVRVTVTRSIEIQLINQTIMLSSTARAVDERML